MTVPGQRRLRPAVTHWAEFCQQLNLRRISPTDFDGAVLLADTSDQWGLDMGGTLVGLELKPTAMRCPDGQFRLLEQLRHRPLDVLIVAHVDGPGPDIHPYEDIRTFSTYPRPSSGLRRKDGNGADKLIEYLLAADGTRRNGWPR